LMGGFGLQLLVVVNVAITDNLPKDPFPSSACRDPTRCVRWS
jgi:hypothetical protein